MDVMIEALESMNKNLDRYLVGAPDGYFTMRAELLLILEDGANISDVWRVTGYTYAVILRNINEMERQGIITTERPFGDQRSRRIFLTERGRIAQTALRYFAEIIKGDRDDLVEQ